MMHDGPEGGPRGSAPNPHPEERPEDWVGAHLGQGHTWASLSSGAPSILCPRGRLAPLKGIHWESRAPINKKHGSGIVFPPFHKPLYALMWEFWCGLLEA